MKNVFSYCTKMQGMTLIEVLIALIITMICFSVMIFYMPLFKSQFLTPAQDIHMFFQQIKDDVNNTSHMEVNEKELVLYDNENRYLYKQSQSNIIRSKNGTGYEIVLQNVKKMEAIYQDYGADLTITDDSGVEWEAALGFRPSVDRRDVE
ncbi:competence type IV pilus minor pilin ComGF [Alteribacillus sp. JSM 102045]|uniref:competence type IV pilus minor pilin ComGF n=1 Tax=Alteribacillus sp. JSM 102045 TaxID=1562101 RepID=UPI0035BF6000